MLFGVVLGLSSFFKSREGGAAVIDGFPFRLFYSFTCGILFLSTALVGLQDLVGGFLFSSAVCCTKRTLSLFIFCKKISLFSGGEKRLCLIILEGQLLC